VVFVGKKYFIPVVNVHEDKVMGPLPLLKQVGYLQVDWEFLK
jgi:hypothetical protein